MTANRQTLHMFHMGSISSIIIGFNMMRSAHTLGHRKIHKQVAKLDVHPFTDLEVGGSNPDAYQQFSFVSFFFAYKCFV
jgi:hypothetical protein